MPNYTYDPNTDYQKLIDQAVSQGNYYMAAIYEQQRNAKISGENMQGVGSTNNYANYLPTAQTQSAYTNPYQQQLDAAIAKVTGNFAYNPDKDPIASAYKKTYLREAERSMKDSLGEYSTMTGGIPSTQAVAAASQAADNYKAQLSAQLAQLGQQAYEREVSNAGLLMSAAQNADNQYYNAISAAMSRWAQLGTADAQVAQVLGVPIGAQTSDAQYQQWQRAMTEKEYADNQHVNALSEAMTLLSAGILPNEALLSAAGITSEQAKQIINAQTYRGGSYSSSKESKGKAVTDSGIIEEAIVAYQSGDSARFKQIMALLDYQGFDADGLAQYIYAHYPYTHELGYTGGGATNPNTTPVTAP